MLNLGVRAHDFGKHTAEEIAEKVAKKEFKSIQLALSKALEGINSDLGCLNPGLAYSISNTFRKKDIQIAVLGCYINPVHPNEVERRKALDRFKEHIRYARDFQCSIVGTELGSFNADFSFHKDNHTERGFNEIVKSVAELVEEAEKFGVIVGVEAVTKYTIGSAQRMKRLLDTIKSNNIQVIFDPVNLLDKDNFEKRDDIIKEAVDILGDRIVVMHAKDAAIIDGELNTVQIGTGDMDYEKVFSLIKHRKQYMNILLEDNREEFMENSIAYLKKCYYL